MKNNIPKPIRIVMFLVALLWIGAMWVKKDIAATLATVPPEGAIPMIVTSLAVTLAKVALLAGVILLAKWMIGKFGGGKQ